jgi:hypothetical protein
MNFGGGVVGGSSRAITIREKQFVTITKLGWVRGCDQARLLQFKTNDRKNFKKRKRESLKEVWQLFHESV